MCFFFIQTHVEPLYSGDTLLHVRIFDLPGISQYNNVRKQELEMVIDGKIKPGAKVIVLISFRFS